MIEAQTPNTSELANVLPLPTEQQEIRESWRRLLKNPLLQSPVILEPFARTVLREAARNGQTIILSLDQTDLGDRFAILMLAVRVGDRSLPNVRLFNSGVSTNLGIWQEAGHEAPWIIAMDCWPTQAAVQDDGARFGVVSCPGSNAACVCCRGGYKPISPYLLSSARS